MRRRVMGEIGGIVGKEGFARGARILLNVHVAAETDAEARGLVARLAADALVVGHLRRKGCGRKRDVGEGKRQAKARGVSGALGVPAGPDPDRKFSVQRARRDLGVPERRAKATLPSYAARSVQLNQQLELLAEERIIVGKVEAEERERFHERTAPDDDLGSAAGNDIDGGKILEDMHRVGGAEDRHRAREANALCLPAIAAITTGGDEIGRSRR